MVRQLFSLPEMDNVQQKWHAKGRVGLREWATQGTFSEGCPEAQWGGCGLVERRSGLRGCLACLAWIVVLEKRIVPPLPQCKAPPSIKKSYRKKCIFFLLRTKFLTVLSKKRMHSPSPPLPSIEARDAQEPITWEELLQNPRTGSCSSLTMSLCTSEAREAMGCPSLYQDTGKEDLSSTLPNANSALE